MNIEKSVIDEVSEAEENNTTQVKIGAHGGGVGSSKAAAKASNGGNTSRTDSTVKPTG